jgi:hypothetical protein
MNMNNSSLPILAFLAVIAATILLPLSATASGIALTVTGVVAMLAADYGREITPLRIPANVVPFEASGRGPATLQKAA